MYDLRVSRNFQPQSGHDMRCTRTRIEATKERTNLEIRAIASHRMQNRIRYQVQMRLTLPRRLDHSQPLE